MAPTEPVLTSSVLDTHPLLGLKGDAPVFDVDSQTGFMAPQPPLTRLPATWEVWESMLDSAVAERLQVGDKTGITEEELVKSERWRMHIREIPVLSTADLTTPVLLRRAHLVLAFLQHFYVQSLPPNVAPIVIPRSIALPMLRVSQTLDIPPLLTFSDTVLYNWHIASACHTPTKGKDTDDKPTPGNVRTHTMFTNSVDEEEFYLCSSRIELRGVEALELMRITMDEMFVGDSIAIRRISTYLKRMATVIDELRGLLLDVKKLCHPDVYYNDVRPWFRGEDSDVKKRKWVFEGVEEDPTLRQPTELSGPSAGQSSLVHVLDIFLGVNHQASATPDRPSFMSRMQTYMPRNHRLFLNHLSANPRPLRAFVLGSKDEEMTNAYNEAVNALKLFRDAHMIISTLYVIGPARRAARDIKESNKGSLGNCASVVATSTDVPLKGTGGTDLVKFLKDTRMRTTEALIKE
ncbi:Indoleamine 2,3-dioxygenase [Macrolepiota fuliginosa MF-IS2]|uniref:Indoleamine 2,3-dioxygenase n=1 Tax=Macrolepiota fuliginosa MF-IS2 TaxID=1400762 RepID=A0A9P5XEB8_9AGAR|nr:Indoleamine 2,3-dioxygenase [Macrolepiota fuliginosa MF-IS2]